MSQAKSKKTKAAWRVYFEPRVIAIMFLGFSAGLPLSLTGQTLSAWMKEDGVSLSAIGLFALVGTPYVFKFLWAPLIDAVRIPFLSHLLGRRRGWLIFTQLGLMGTVYMMGGIDPTSAPFVMAALAVGVATWSATQDIVIDAFRIESLDEDQIAAGVANYVAAYRIAMLVATTGAFEIVSYFQDSGYSGQDAWSMAYSIMAGFVLVGILTVLMSSEPDSVDQAQVLVGHESDTWQTKMALRMNEAVAQPFLDFMRKPQWIMLLLFVVLFKFGDAIAGVMTLPFILDIGFEKTDYGRIGKIVGLIATLAGGFAGGYVQRSFGMLKALWIAGIVQMLSNLVFCWQAIVGVDLFALGVTMTVESFTGGLGTIVLVAYLSSLCTNKEFTATQYALLSALTAVGRTFLASYGGFVAEAVNWVVFFGITTVAAIPGLILLYWLGNHKGLILDPGVKAPSSDMKANDQ
jgi:PAT family beta-lactamase induction signal transducer AmpG